MASAYTDVETITYDDYLKLLGLVKMAGDHRQILEWILLSVRSITGERESGGHSDDAVWTDTLDAALLLERLGITVLPASPLPPIFQPPILGERASREEPK